MNIGELWKKKMFVSPCKSLLTKCINNFFKITIAYFLLQNMENKQDMGTNAKNVN